MKWQPNVDITYEVPGIEYTVYIYGGEEGKLQVHMQSRVSCV